MSYVTVEEVLEHIRAEGRSVKYLPWYGEYVVLDAKGNPIATVAAHSRVEREVTNKDGSTEVVVVEYGIRRPDSVRYKGAIDEVGIKSPEKIAEEIARGIRVPPR